MNKAEVLRLFRRIVLVYTFFEPSEEALNEWSELLVDQDAELVNKRFTEYAKANRRAPVVADLIAPVENNPALQAGDSAIREIEEWERNAVPPPPLFHEKLEELRRAVRGRDKHRG